jgi:hypothetical protein
MSMRSRLLSACALSSLCVAACDSTDPPGAPVAITAVTSTTLTMTVGAAADTLGVKVVDAEGRAVHNAQVAWSVDGVSALAAVSPTVSITDRAGVARTALTVGPVAGSTTVRANVAGAGTVAFSLTITPGAAAQLQAVGVPTVGVPIVSRPWITARDSFGNAASLSRGLALQSSNPAVAT